LLLAIPLGSMLVHYGAADRSHDRLSFYAGEDLLAPLDQGALFLITGDGPADVIAYLQLVEGRRRDVVAVPVGRLGQPSYIQQMARQHPEVDIPFDSYKSADDIIRLVEANLPSRSVYVDADQQGTLLSERFEIEPVGMVTKLVPKGSDSDPNSLLETKIALLESAHFPGALARESTVDWALDQGYGELAVAVGDSLARSNQDAQAAEFYRRAITLEPSNALAYRDLGSVLSKEGAPTSEIVPLWEEYLRVDPGDAQAAAIAQQLRQMSLPP